MLAIQRVIVLGCLLMIGGTASAQSNWPDRPIRLIVTTAAGGGIDLAARILADGMSRHLPQRVVVENQGAAGGLAATRIVAKSDPDGYTFLFQGPGHTYLPHLHRDPGYDVRKDFAGVSLAISFPSVLVTHPDLPAATLPEFIALVKAAPGKYSFGTSGIGGASDIPLEAFLQQAGLQMLHVPYRGSGQATVALLGKEIDLVLDGLPAQIGNIREGRVRALATAGPTRTPYMPELPAVAETLPGYQASLWLAIFAPAKTSPEIIQKMRAALVATFKDPELRKRYEDNMIEIIGSTPEELDAFVAQQLEVNGKVIKNAGIPPVD
jgi:tripartite-type tricarboxylate transporter receptor subunit TctC